MPEGDTIFRTATVLRRALVGGVVRRAVAQPGPGLSRVPDLSVLVGASVEAVEARGKHLLIGFSGGRWLRTHMRMKGSWHRYRPGEPWRLPARRAVCVLETEAVVAVCFDAPVVELLTDSDLARHGALRALGPDLLARVTGPGRGGAAAARACRPCRLARPCSTSGRWRGSGTSSSPSRSSWSGWIRGRRSAPSRTRSCTRCWTRASTLLAANTGGGRRVTTGRRSPGEALWVYRRPAGPAAAAGRSSTPAARELRHGPRTGAPAASPRRYRRPEP